jgi:ERCC4-type nuclease
MPTLIIDENENSQAPQIVEQLRKVFNPVIVANLPHRSFGNTSVTAGDINIPLEDGNILAIERKTAIDFLNSIKNRHILNQVEVMATHAKYSAIIITGKIMYSPEDKVIADRKQTEWGGKSVRALLDVIQYSGCVIRYCPVSEYAYMVREIYEVVNNPSEHRGIVKNRIVTFPPIDERVQFLAQLPSVGLESAESLLKFAGMMEDCKDEEGYGTLANALHWMSILTQIDLDSRPKLWGSKKILTNRKFLGLESNQYLKIESE